MNFPVVFTGKVISGNQLGRTIGFPTVNIPVAENQVCSLVKGVYAARVLYNQNWYDGMANLGIRPTIKDNHFLLEINIFDFSEDIYDKEITVYLYDFIREEKEFPGLDELKDQIINDKKIILQILRLRSKPDSDTQ
ncbi:MAG: riboflavin kinase [Bacteroidota bacterium]|nr:riboflavin kinase [Bacteroidota bacterium]